MNILKTHPFISVSITTILILVFSFQNQTPTANEIIKKANENRYGNSSESTMKMTIVRPKYTRSLTMKTWTLGQDYAMVLITEPAKEKGQVFLKRKTEMWNYIPSINRMIKLPASMMSQGWMGSDFTNDDMVNEGALVTQFDHKLIGSEKVENVDCYVIESKPKPNSDVIWGKKITWVSKDKFFPLKMESYDEEMELIKTELASQIKQLGGKWLPCVYTIIPEDLKNQKTILEILSIDFEKKLQESYFTQQNMKLVR